VAVLMGTDGGTMFDNTRILKFTPTYTDYSTSPSTVSGLVRVSLDVGDVDGDGANELVLAGQSIEDMTTDSKTYTRYLAFYEYDSDESSGTYNTMVLAGGTDSTMDLSEEAYQLTGYSYYGNENYYKRYFGYYSEWGLNSDMVCVKSGPSSAEYIYLDGAVYVLSGTSFSVVSQLDEQPGFNRLSGVTASVDGLIAGDDTFEYNTTHTEDEYYYHEYGAVAADLDGDGVESVYLMQIFTGKE